jgi:predicted phosphohydrolase
MKLIWCTDLHFNFVPNASFPKLFGKELSALGDTLVITGDTSEGPTLEHDLTELAAGFEKQIYFLVGNHDYYKNSIKNITSLARKLQHKISNLFYLPTYNGVLNQDTILVGSDGWYDCKVGDPYRLGMSDFTLIEEFQGHHIDDIIRLSRIEAGTLAMEADYKIRQVVKEYKNIYFATHVPPFPHPDKKKRSLTWDPWFTWTAMGEALAGIAEDFPDNNFTILAGHRHIPFTYKHSHNMVMLVGEANYGSPDVVKVFDI